VLTIYTFFAAGATIICSLLALIIYQRNHKGFLNQIFIVSTVFGAYWAFTILMMIQATDTETAILWKNVGFLWPILFALVFLFTLAFTENRFRKSKLVYLLVITPTAILSFWDLLTDEISGQPVMQYSGYVFAGQSNLANLIFNVWTFGLALGAVYLSFRFYIKTKEETKKNQAKLVTIALAMPVVFKVIIKLVSLALGITIPFYGPSVDSVLCLIIAYAIWKHNLFNINPAMAAENIIETMPDSFILTDSSGQILRTNSALTDLLGYKEKELTGKKIEQLLDQKSNPELISSIGNLEIKNQETQILAKSGTTKPVAVSASLIKNKRGKKIGSTIIIHDLTRQKQDAEIIIKNQRFATIGELAGMVGHDLRNPLNSMQAATYYIKKKNFNQMDSTSQEMVQIMQSSIQYSNKIIDDLLDYSRELTLELTDVAISQLVHNALLMVEVPPNIKVVNITQDTPVVTVDKVKINRVIVNIVKNSFDAMPDGGKLTITSQQTENNLEVSFTDTGTGMSKEVLDKLWKPLFTTKAKGMGFGLPICKRILEAHGGKIHATSTDGKGATFTITLPIKP
jgi:PAS domain S-box-containing protein